MTPSRPLVVDHSMVCDPDPGSLEGPATALAGAAASKDAISKALKRRMGTSYFLPKSGAWGAQGPDRDVHNLSSAQLTRQTRPSDTRCDATRRQVRRDLLPDAAKCPATASPKRPPLALAPGENALIGNRERRPPMTTLIPYRNSLPFGTLFDDLMMWQPAGSQTVWSAFPAPVTVEHTDESATITADMPGVEPND